MTTSSSINQLNEQTITIVGVGLIGGSIAAALKQRGYNGKIIGVGRNQDRLQTAMTVGLIDEVTTDLTVAASQSSLIIFCTPVKLIAQQVLAASSHCRSGCLMTDAGSVKGAICNEIADQLPQEIHFVGSHPLAGSEKQGHEYAESDLYQNKVCIITPVATSPAETVSRLKQFWEFVGMRVAVMTPTEHDQVVSQTSHLPHLLASVLVQAMMSDETIDYAASGFRDSTRIAAGDADLWTSILLDNADAVLEGLEKYRDVLEVFRRTLHNRDAQTLKNMLQNAKTTREKLDQ